jgi:hypothetical protein
LTGLQIFIAFEYEKAVFGMLSIWIFHSLALAQLGG